MADYKAVASAVDGYLEGRKPLAGYDPDAWFGDEE